MLTRCIEESNCSEKKILNHSITDALYQMFPINIVRTLDLNLRRCTIHRFVTGQKGIGMFL